MHKWSFREAKALDEVENVQLSSEIIEIVVIDMLGYFLEKLSDN